MLTIITNKKLRNFVYFIQFSSTYICFYSNTRTSVNHPNVVVEMMSGYFY